MGFDINPIIILTKSLDPPVKAFFMLKNMSDNVRKLGTEKVKVFKENFDGICDRYQSKAIKEGYYGDLLFKKEHGNMVIFVTLDVE